MTNSLTAAVASDAPRDTLICRAFGVQVKAFNEERRSVDVIASSEAIDAYDEVVIQDWDLSRYERNPVVLYNHNASSMLGPMHAKDTLPIGYAENVRVDGGQLLVTLFFVDERANPMAELVYQGFKQKSIRAVSVGFRSKEAIEEKRDGKSVYKLRGNQLCEISVVPMGANPDAVAEKRALDQLRALAARGRPVGGVEAKSSPRPDETNAAAGSHGDNSMDIEQVKSDLELKTKALGTAESRVADLEKSLEAERTLRAAHESTVKTLSTQLEESRAAADVTAKDLAGLRDTMTEKDVDGLVGVKFLPVERDAMLALAKSDRKTFDVLMAVRPALALTGKRLAVEPPTAVRPSTKGATGVAAPRPGEAIAPTGGDDLGAMYAADIEADESAE